MRAYRKALAWVSLTEPFEVAGRLASLFPRVGSGPLGAAIRAYQELGCWKVDPAIPVEQYERAAEVFLFSGGITRRHPFTEVVVPPPA
jgi:hypothetical protein